jgi:integrase
MFPYHWEYHYASELMAILTLREMHTLRPGAEIAADSACPGLVVRVDVNGRRTWAYRYRADGVLRRMTLGAVPETQVAKPHEMPLSSARKAYYEARAERQRVGDPVAKRRAERLQRALAVKHDALTVRKTVDAFLKARRERLAQSTLDQYEYHLEREVISTLGPDTPIAALTRTQLQVAVISPTAQRGKGVYGNRVAATVKAWLAWAETEYGIESPAARIKIDRRVKSVKDRVLTETEATAFWKATEGGDRISQCLRLILLTGLRPGEAASLSKDNVESTRLTIPTTKNGRAHAIPISEAAKAAINSAQRQNEGPIFATRVDTLAHRIQAMTGVLYEKAAARRAKRSRKTIRRGRKRAIPPLTGCVPFTPHDLRRTALTMLARLGCPLEVVQKIANHAPSGVTQRVYVRHGYENEMRLWLDRLGAYITELAAGKVVNIGSAADATEKAA